MIKLSQYLKQAMAIRFNWEYKDGKRFLYSTQKKWPGILITKHSDVDYTAITFNTPAKVMKLIMKDPEEYVPAIFNEDIDNFTLTWFGKTYSELTQSGYKDFERLTSKRLKTHMDILMTYGRLDQIKHFAEKLLYERKEKLNKEQLYKYLVLKHKLREDMFVDTYGEVSIDSKDHVVKFKKWEILFDDSKKIDPKGVTNLLEKVESTLNTKKMGQLAYGKVFIVDRLSGKGLADYNPVNDQIRIGQRRKSKELDSFIHELGHRYHYKILGKSNKTVQDMFHSKKHKTTRAKVGDELLELSTENKYKVIETKYSRGNVYYISELIEVGESSKVFKSKVGAKFKIPSSMIGSELEVVSKTGSDEDSFFPTGYSKQNHIEFFAELFLYYMNNALKEPAKSWFQSILK